MKRLILVLMMVSAALCALCILVACGAASEGALSTTTPISSAPSSTSTSTSTTLSSVSYRTTTTVAPPLECQDHELPCAGGVIDPGNKDESTIDETLNATTTTLQVGDSTDVTLPRTS